jgi:hypothetical protein
MAAAVLGQVEENLDHSKPEDDPDWVYWLNREEIDVMAGRCYTELKQPARAEPLLRNATSGYDNALIRGESAYPCGNWSGHLVPLQATSARSVCGLGGLAILIDWRELEYGVAVCLGDEVFHGRVLGRQEIPSGGCGDADVSLEDRPGLCGSNLPDGVFTGVTPAGQGHPPGRSGVVHPGHGAVGGDQPPSPVALDWDHGVGTRLAGLAALGG